MKACMSISSRFPWYLITGTEFAGREPYSSQQSHPTQGAEGNICRGLRERVQVQAGHKTL